MKLKMQTFTLINSSITISQSCGFAGHVLQKPQDSGSPRLRSRKGAPGILDVALRADVSSATVTRYFNNPEVVRPSIRARIELAARELGYIRDRMAGVLHGKMSGTIGLIVPTINHAIF
ncbi:MAG: hypothetical protein ACI9US_003211, partial [Gammaproteobacteria bacterium]